MNLQKTHSLPREGTKPFIRDLPPGLKRLPPGSTANTGDHISTQDLDRTHIQTLSGPFRWDTTERIPVMGHAFAVISAWVSSYPADSLKKKTIKSPCNPVNPATNVLLLEPDSPTIQVWELSQQGQGTSSMPTLTSLS